jgi:very-short-patch-repair endonuclease
MKSNILKYPKPDMLVCLLKEKDDFMILKNEGWYRIPVKSSPVNLYHMKYLSFYQPKKFGDDKYLIKYYGLIGKKSIKKRKDLFPQEELNEKSEKEYYKIEIPNLLQKEVPIISKKGRMMVFIKTTFEKFNSTCELNDLFHESPLEDKLWIELKKNNIKSERQFYYSTKAKTYILDFATFCKNANLDIECDGDSFHISKEKAIEDNQRDNFLTKKGWKILRYSTKQLDNINECVSEISETIYNNGGIQSEERMNKHIEKENCFYNKKSRTKKMNTNKSTYPLF